MQDTQGVLGVPCKASAWGVLFPERDGEVPVPGTVPGTSPRDRVCAHAVQSPLRPSFWGRPPYSRTQFTLAKRDTRKY